MTKDVKLYLTVLFVHIKDIDKYCFKYCELIENTVLNLV